MNSTCYKFIKWYLNEDGRYCYVIIVSLCTECTWNLRLMLNRCEFVTCLLEDSKKNNLYSRFKAIVSVEISMTVSVNYVVAGHTKKQSSL